MYLQKFMNPQKSTAPTVCSHFSKITIPMIKSTILMNTTVTIIGAFMVFDEVYVMTSGGPGKSTEVLATTMYETGFRHG